MIETKFEWFSINDFHPGSGIGKVLIRILFYDIDNMEKEVSEYTREEINIIHGDRENWYVKIIEAEFLTGSSRKNEIEIKGLDVLPFQCIQDCNESSNMLFEVTHWCKIPEFE